MIQMNSLAWKLYLSLSLVGLLLAAMLVYFGPRMPGSTPWRKPLVGAAFGIVCVLGISAGIFPSKCSSTFHFRRGERNNDRKSIPQPENSQTLLFQGHHPNCGNFGPHIFRVGNSILCAGCVGLVSGAAVSTVGAALYFLGGVSCSPGCSLVFWIGFVGAFCGLLQYQLFSWGRSSVHLFINAFFVFGVFLLLVGVDAIAESLLFDLYLVALSLFWVYTRIILSQFDHRRICAACTLEECELFV